MDCFCYFLLIIDDKQRNPKELNMPTPMKNADNFWLCMDDPTNLMVITGLMEFDKPLDYERLCATFEHRMLCFDRFKQRVVRPVTGVGIPNWEYDKNFDIRSHIHRTALPHPSDKATLQEMILSRYSTR